MGVKLATSLLEGIINRDVIHAQGARIRAQGAPGYAHKGRAHKQVVVSQEISFLKG
jgi:hypothetical protein